MTTASAVKQGLVPRWLIERWRRARLRDRRGYIICSQSQAWDYLMNTLRLSWLDHWGASAGTSGEAAGIEVLASEPYLSSAMMQEALDFAEEWGLNLHIEPVSYPHARPLREAGVLPAGAGVNANGEMMTEKKTVRPDPRVLLQLWEGWQPERPELLQRLYPRKPAPRPKPESAS